MTGCIGMVRMVEMQESLNVKMRSAESPIQEAVKFFRSCGFIGDEAICSDMFATAAKAIYKEKCNGEF